MMHGHKYDMIETLGHCNSIGISVSNVFGVSVCVVFDMCPTRVMTRTCTNFQCVLAY
ncbi:uncharacterized protein M6B38_137955 [Iris pallida]|uniref:Uncharacterized protein n=1 Tax=Iris pallida TaxID=29817 RepID=A0AAX6FE62_IRIPA|nr:uncharacterized protein M6B38_137955 [Iris pallida]